MACTMREYRNREKSLRFWAGEANSFLKGRKKGERCPAYLKDLLRRSLTNFIFTRKYLCGLEQTALERRAAELLRELIQ